MVGSKPKIRLFVPTSYHEGQAIALEAAQSHYLAGVMRCVPGDVVALFNGSDGEWLAEITQVGKKSVALVLKSLRRAQIYSPDVWLAFAPIKNKSELVVEKATELGVSKILPVFMRHSVVTKVNMEKLSAHAIEAAEQCERHDVPVIEEVQSLPALLSRWPTERTLLFADEGGSGEALAEVLAALPQGAYGVLVGPEGGFHAEEQKMLAQMPFVKPFSMGPRILRADTAAVAALACVMEHLGDWRQKPRFEAAV